jgi:hypothetical protein
MRVFHNIFVLTRSYSDRQRALKWVLLVKIPRIFLDATASVLTRLGNAAAQLVLRTQPRRAALRTASVRQDQRKYCVLLESQLANGLRPSCKPACQRTAFFLKASLPTDCVLASLRQAVRSALRSDKLQGVRSAQASCKECASLSRSER